MGSLANLLEPIRAFGNTFQNKTIFVSANNKDNNYRLWFFRQRSFDLKHPILGKWATRVTGLAFIYWNGLKSWIDLNQIKINFGSIQHRVKASSLDRINMTEFQLEHDQKKFTPTNFNMRTWPKNHNDEQYFFGLVLMLMFVVVNFLVLSLTFRHIDWTKYNKRF